MSYDPNHLSHSHNKQNLIHKIKFIEKEIKKGGAKYENEKKL